MIKKLINFIALVVLGVITYNYFFGTDEQRAAITPLKDQVLEYGEKSFKFLGNQLANIRSGKYDEDIDKFRNKVRGLKGKIKDANVQNKVANWKEKHQEYKKIKNKLTGLLDAELKNGKNNEQPSLEIQELSKVFEKAKKSLESEALALESEIVIK